MRLLMPARHAHVVLDELESLLGRRPVALFRSGREALRVALRQLAEASGRDEVIIPAYCCYSVPAAAVAAGLRVRLVDVDSSARIDVQALRSLPLEGAAAIVVGNLFGLPEPIPGILELADTAGVVVVDDAAQSLGARDSDGPVGARTPVGILSFGRAKPLSALGGGALLWDGPNAPSERPDIPSGSRIGALAKAVGFQLSLSRFVFPVLAALPFLHVGESVFDDSFPGGAISRSSLVVASALIPELANLGPARALAAETLAQQIEAVTTFAPLLAPSGADGVYPRLALLAKGSGMRDAAVAQVRAVGAGASPMYPKSLDQIEPLQPHLIGDALCPGARDVATRLMTLRVPTSPESRLSQKVIAALAGFY